MRHRSRPEVSGLGPRKIDVKDSGYVTEDHEVKLEGLDLLAYRARVQGVLEELFDESPVLQKIKAGSAVTEEELGELADKVRLRDPQLRLDDLLSYFPDSGTRLEDAIRSIVGRDAEAVDRHFGVFMKKNPGLTAHQLRFLQMLRTFIVKNGKVEIEQLYETPFTSIDSEGLDGVFTDEEQVADLLRLIETISAT